MIAASLLSSASLRVVRGSVRVDSAESLRPGRGLCSGTMLTSRGVSDGITVACTGPELGRLVASGWMPWARGCASLDERRSMVAIRKVLPERKEEES